MLCYCCGKKMFCPCKHCIERHEEEVVWIWKEGNEEGLIACGHCGFTMSVDDWQELEFELQK